MVDEPTRVAYVIRTTAEFERTFRKTGATAADREALIERITTSPKSGAVIPGLKGARKLRFGIGSKGRSGGGRAIYYLLTRRSEAFLFTAFAKADQADLSSA